MCARLDGIPLAIELAAARVSLFSIEDLAHRLDQRFRLLTGGRGAVERHQTLRAAVDWSYDLLTPVEREVFARLSVFASGCTMVTAEAVVVDDDHPLDQVLDLLSGLVDKSLVTVDRTHSVTRYDMLETIRQYAHERLVESGEAETIRRRHALGTRTSPVRRDGACGPSTRNSGSIGFDPRSTISRSRLGGP